MLQPIEPMTLLAVLFWLVTVTAALIVPPDVVSVNVRPSSVALFTVPAAIVYGPTKGPPPPTGAAPAGSTESLDVSCTERSRFSRPFPVCAVVPAASAFFARRETMTPFDAPSADVARMRPAAPATIAAAAEVPVTLAYPPPAVVVRMLVPGAARNVSSP